MTSDQTSYQQNNTATEISNYFLLVIKAFFHEPLVKRH